MEEKKGKVKIIIPVLLVVILVVVGGFLFIFKDKLFSGEGSNTESHESKKTIKSDLKMVDNSLSEFDLAFLKIENGEENKIYSPLSIKYALEMLAEGADGDTKAQLDAVIGEYTAKKYVNSNNMSFANALFIRNSFKDSVKEDYISNLKNVYNAEVMFDEFKSPKLINDWVSGKTFKLIPNLMDDVSDLDYVLVNALAIDMEWNKKIQSEHEDYNVHFKHLKEQGTEEEYGWVGAYVSPLDSGGYHQLEFEGSKDNVKSADISAIANRYDIVTKEGEANIRKTVLAEYEKWKKDNKEEDYYSPFNIDTYMNDLKSAYKHVSSSTDFMFYVDDDVKVFAKDLKTYNGTTLQYVGIMPKETKLATYIDKTSAKDLNTLIGNLKNIELDSFEDGYITIIDGYIPMFDYEYELKLMDDLKAIGITDVFDSSKADLSKLSSTKTYIDTAVHKANIEFSNEGIKAAAATAMGGRGSADGGFDYFLEAPVKRIDLTFDKPYMYIIRDKATGEVWFTGTVYQPKVEENTYEWE